MNAKKAKKLRRMAKDFSLMQPVGQKPVTVDEIYKKLKKTKIKKH